MNDVSLPPLRLALPRRWGSSENSQLSSLSGPRDQATGRRSITLRSISWALTQRLALVGWLAAQTALAQSTEPASQPSTAPTTTPSIDPPTTGTAVRPDDIIAVIPGPQWTITVDPLTTALGFAHVQVERVVTPGFSIYAGPHAHLFSSVFAQEREDYLGFGLELGLRKFFKPNAPRGAWGQVRGVLARASSDATGQLEANAAGYVSALIGYTYIHRSGLVLSGGAGAQYLNYQVKAAQQGVEGFFPALHSNIGFAF